jgi:hypothetical protein
MPESEIDSYQRSLLPFALRPRTHLELTKMAQWWELEAMREQPRDPRAAFIGARYRHLAELARRYGPGDPKELKKAHAHRHTSRCADGRRLRNA